jgi:predicted Zn-dependent peptidase
MVAHHRRWYLPNNAAVILAGDLDPAATIAALELAFETWSPGQLPPPPAGGSTARSVASSG